MTAGSLDEPTKLIIDTSDTSLSGTYDVYIYAEVLSSGESGEIMSAISNTFKLTMYDCSETTIIDDQEFPVLSIEAMSPASSTFEFTYFEDTYSLSNPNADCGT